MKEIIFKGDKIYIRKLHQDGDEFNIFPRGKFEQRQATEEDIKRINPKLWKELFK